MIVASGGPFDPYTTTWGTTRVHRRVTVEIDLAHPDYPVSDDGLVPLAVLDRQSSNAVFTLTDEGGRLLHRIRRSQVQEILYNELLAEIATRVKEHAEPILRASAPLHPLPLGDWVHDRSAPCADDLAAALYELIVRPPNIAGLEEPLFADGGEQGGPGSKCQREDADVIRSNVHLERHLDRLARMPADATRVAVRLHRQSSELLDEPKDLAAVSRAIEAARRTRAAVGAIARDPSLPISIADPAAIAALRRFDQARRQAMREVAISCLTIGRGYRHRAEWQQWAALCGVDGEEIRQYRHRWWHLGPRLLPPARQACADLRAAAAALEAQLAAVFAARGHANAAGLAAQIAEPLSNLAVDPRDLAGDAWAKLGSRRAGRRLQRDLWKFGVFAFRAELAIVRFEQQLRAAVQQVHRRDPDSETLRWIAEIAHGGPHVDDLAFFGQGQGTALVGDKTVRRRVLDAARNSLLVVDIRDSHLDEQEVGIEDIGGTEAAELASTGKSIQRPAGSTVTYLTPKAQRAQLTYEYTDNANTPQVDDNPLRPEPGFFRRAVARIPYRVRQRIVIPVPNAARATTYHLTFDVPPETFITEARVEATTDRGRRRSYWSLDEPAGSIAHVHIPPLSARPTDNAVFVAALLPSSVGLALWTLLLTTLSTVTVFATAATIGWLGLREPPQGGVKNASFAEIAAAGVLLLPALAAGLMIVPSQHNLAERLHRPFKGLLALVVVTALTATGLLAIWSQRGIEGPTMVVGALVLISSTLTALMALALEVRIAWLARSDRVGHRPLRSREERMVRLRRSTRGQTGAPDA